MKLSERIRNMSLSWTTPYEQGGFDLIDEVEQLEEELESYLRLDEDGYASLAVGLAKLEEEVEWWKKNSEEHSEGRAIWRDKAKQLEEKNEALLKHEVENYQKTRWLIQRGLDLEYRQRRDALLTGGDDENAG